MVAFALMAVSQLTRKAAASVTIVLAFGGYVVSSLADIVHWLKVPARLMPYHYYNTVALLNGHINYGVIVYLVGGAVIAICASAVGYARRDIG